MSTNLNVAREGRVLRVTLNRPDKRNALNFTLCRELVETVDGAARDPGVGAVLLAANGKVFSAGMDLEEALEEGAAERSEVHEQLFTLGARVSRPIVAAVGGPALGGGLGLVANAHIVVAAQGSSFGLTEIRIGMWPFAVHRAVALALGERRTVELSLSGRVFGTQEALQWGLVHHVVPAFEVDDRAMEIAAAVASWSPTVIRSGLSFIQEARGLGWSETGQLALRLRDEVFRGTDFAEGVRAFREKRAPRWPSLQNTPETATKTE